ncbi:SusC/RagA family TonB-linked outer membrane protein [Belliella kenyensis]|uniref:SusC/RagA family TonB-linked outer membrane protein n=1 Tax=Belliella kenyensis TaxID=1472724 RepID=A0ABV8EM17_9BACT|nr:SusC/RagA family TonB-linked outer membrane protein [Belliella kenyensis]MCH7403731.1 SusC/RagA family TonB-linked outer membrane protein [Belliella kenyensis]MDN3602480.1 SusC/RagA family TonB-linked outer membrane protein [Belliella kenyensis]
MRKNLQQVKVFMLIVLLMSAVFNVNAQSREVSGTVMDKTMGEPLPGVTVLVKGTTRGVTTDLDGKYRISLQGGDQVLVFSFVGFTAQEVTIGNQSTINVELDEDIQSLQEAVVIGYGTQDKKEITSAVASIGTEGFNKGNFTNPQSLLTGKVAGLNISTPGGSPNAQPTVRLRGISSFGANSSPLIVLDGVIGASIDAVDPNDIETIDVLKDASAAAIYGTRGAAGVILITTKQGSSKKGFANVTINTFGTAEQATGLIPVLSPDEFRARRPSTSDFGSNTNWRDEILRTALNATTNASVSGGYENTNYFASVNYRNNQGVVKNSGRETLNTRLNLNHGALNNRLRMNLSLAFTNTEANDVPGDALLYATILNPTMPVYSNDPDLSFAGYFRPAGFDNNNPVSLINERTNQTKVRNAIYSYRAEYDITDDLIVSAQFSQDVLNTLNGQYSTRRDGAPGGGGANKGIAQQNTYDRTNTIISGNLRYEKEIFDGMNMSLLGGAETQLYEDRAFGAQARQFLYDQSWNNLGAGGIRFGDNTNLYSNATKSILNSVFTRANFNFRNTYFFSATLRAETYSGFGPENQTGYFPAFSAGSDLTQIFDMGPFNQFKLRGSFGIVGQLPPSPTLALGIYGNGNRILLDPTELNSANVAPRQLNNPNQFLKWETTRELTLGWDYALFNGKITGSMDYYIRNIQDLLFEVGVNVGQPNPFNPRADQPGQFFPYTANTIWANIAGLNSAGFEFLMSANDIKLGGGVTWTPTAIFTIYKRARIQDIGAGGLTLPEIRRGVPGAPGVNNAQVIRNIEGQLVGDIYGPRVEGILENGTVVLSTTSPDEFERLGNALPTGDFGFTNQFNYKNFDLNFLLRGSWGHQMLNSFRLFYEGDGNATWNSVVTKNTPSSPRITSTPSQISDLYIERGDFIRLDNLQFGYNIPTKSSAISNFRFYAGVQNLFTISSFTGVDPEVRWGDPVDNGFDQLAPGIERRSTYFIPRIWTTGLTITFK